jgi:hypothetical protein
MTECSSPNDYVGNPLAFFSLAGRQQGQYLPVLAGKCMLQFEADGSNDSQLSTHCLIIPGTNGVTIRTLQGEVQLNNETLRDGWVSVGDEISCGNTRLRLVSGPTASKTSFESESIPKTDPANHPPVAMPSNPQASSVSLTDSTCEPKVDPDATFFRDFQPITPPNSADANQTICLSPNEIRFNMEPMVYGDDSENKASEIPLGHLGLIAPDAPSSATKNSEPPAVPEMAVGTDCSPPTMAAEVPSLSTADAVKAPVADRDSLPFQAPPMIDPLPGTFSEGSGHRIAEAAVSDDFPAVDCPIAASTESSASPTEQGAVVAEQLTTVDLIPTSVSQASPNDARFAESESDPNRRRICMGEFGFVDILEIGWQIPAVGNELRVPLDPKEIQGVFVH